VATYKKHLAEGRFIPGKPPWTGNKRDKKTIEKLRIAAQMNWQNPEYASKMVFVTGHKLYNTGRTHFKKGEHLGKNSFNWRGGITPKKKAMWSSTDYQLWRASIYKRDDYTCQLIDCPYCKNKRGGELHAHHIQSVYNNPQLIFDIDNGITLCKLSHKAYHTEYGWGMKRKQHKEVLGSIIQEGNKFKWVNENGTTETEKR
jgi:hypothetical protein